jgi:hypothetical protein
MATLDTLSNLITNAKQTPSGKVEWTDTSLKGLQDEVKYLFSQNAIQVVPTTAALSTTDNDSSQLAFVTLDTNDANNGLYFWNLTAVSAIFFPAGSNGYWNLIEFGMASSIPAGYLPYSNGTSLVPSYLKRTVNEIKMEGGSFVANNSLTTGPYFQCGDTDSLGNDVILTIDDKNQVINSKKGTANKGIKLDFANNIHKIGDIDANKGLSVDTANSVYKLGNTATSEGVVINLNNGYIGNPTWGYTYNATTLYAGNASINLTLSDTANTATLGDGTKGLTVDVTNNGYILGNGTNGLNINTGGTYTLGNGTEGLSINTTTDDYTLGTANYGLIIDTPFSVNLGDLVNGNGLIIDNTGDTYSLANSVSGKGLFIDATNDDYTLGSTTYGLVVDATIPLASTAFLGSISSGNGLYIFNGASNADIYNLSNQTVGKGLFINLAAETYILGTFAGYGLSLTATTGRLGYTTFGYNYTATTLVAGNSSINLTINDTANTANVGIATQGLLVDVTNSLYKLGDLSTSTGLSLGATTGYLGSSIFGYNFTATTLIAGNSSINLTLNDTTNVGTLGSTSYGFRANMSTSVLNAGTTVYGLMVDLPNSKIQLNGNGYGLEVLGLGNVVRTFNGTTTEGLYIDLLGSNYSLGGNAVGLNIANTSKTLQTYLNPGSTGANVNGLDFNYTNDTYLLGGEYATKSAAIGVKDSRTATPQVQVGSDLVVAAAVSGTQLEKIRVFIPGVGVRYIPVYLS